VAEIDALEEVKIGSKSGLLRLDVFGPDGVRITDLQLREGEGAVSNAGQDSKRWFRGFDVIDLEIIIINLQATVREEALLTSLRDLIIESRELREEGLQADQSGISLDTLTKDGAKFRKSIL